MNRDVDLINYRYAFIKYMGLWYFGFTLCLVSIFRWEFDAFLFFAFGVLIFSAFLSQPLYTEIALSKKLKNSLIKIYIIDFFIIFIGCVLFFPFLILKLFTFIWLCAVSLGHEVKGSFQ